MSLAIENETRIHFPKKWNKTAAHAASMVALNVFLVLILTIWDISSSSAFDLFLGLNLCYLGWILYNHFKNLKYSHPDLYTSKVD